MCACESEREGRVASYILNPLERVRTCVLTALLIVRVDSTFIMCVNSTLHTEGMYVCVRE